MDVEGVDHFQHLKGHRLRVYAGSRFSLLVSLQMGPMSMRQGWGRTAHLHALPVISGREAYVAYQRPLLCQRLPVLIDQVHRFLGLASVFRPVYEAVEGAVHRRYCLQQK